MSLIPSIDILKDIRKWPNTFNSIAKNNQVKYNLCDYHTIKTCLLFNYLIYTNNSRHDLLEKTIFWNMIKKVCKKSFNKKCGNANKMNIDNVFHLSLRIYTYIELFINDDINNSDKLFFLLKNIANNKKDFDKINDYIFGLFCSSKIYIKLVSEENEIGKLSI